MRYARALASLLSRPRALAVAFLGAAVTALVLAVPTAVLPNPFFTRMTPVRPLDVVFLAAMALLGGLIAATYAGGRDAADLPTRGGAAGLLGFLAIGCPICNKVVVALLGVSGAFTYFEPVQPLLGAAGLALGASALVLRLRALEGCSLPTVRRATAGSTT